MELHSKVDYLIRMAPGSTSGSSMNTSMMNNSATADASTVIRGVERLANENERLLVQINSQTHQYNVYEKKLEELMKQLQKTQEEKNKSDEKNVFLSTQQVQWNQEMASQTSARDAAITQFNRLHSEYQQLLTAFYQKQNGNSDSGSQLQQLQQQELAFEKENRVRLEKELKKETQTRGLLEQELC